MLRFEMVFIWESLHMRQTDRCVRRSEDGRQRKTARPSPQVIGKDSVKNRHGGNKQYQFRPR
jgi:hypothetical protein